jgi:hypothetical protein
MHKVYAVGVIHAELIDNRDPKEPVWKIQSSRLWSLFSSFEMAQNKILHNYGDIFENYYNFGLIEEITLADSVNQQGSYPTPPQWWYQASVVEDNCLIIPIPRPNMNCQIECFLVG